MYTQTPYKLDVPLVLAFKLPPPSPQIQNTFWHPGEK